VYVTWFPVSVDDLVTPDPLALEDAPRASFVRSGKGEESLRRIAEAVSHHGSPNGPRPNGGPICPKNSATASRRAERLKALKIRTVDICLRAGAGRVVN
jgi:hypothetical protein